MDRHLANTNGRFQSPDKGHMTWYLPVSLNRYVYTFNDPINFTDRTGNEAEYVLRITVTGAAPGTGPTPPPLSPAAQEVLAEMQRNRNRPDLPPAQEAQRPRGGRDRDYCDTNDPTNARVISFIRNNTAAAEELERSTGLSADFILAWAGFESQYGTSNVAMNNNNFFGLMTSNWSGATSCVGIAGANSVFACFAGANSLAASGASALSSANGRYLTAALEAQRQRGTPQDIANAIARARFNSEPNVDYGASVDSAYSAIQRRKDCPQ